MFKMTQRRHLSGALASIQLVFLHVWHFLLKGIEREMMESWSDWLSLLVLSHLLHHTLSKNRRAFSATN